MTPAPKPSPARRSARRLEPWRSNASLRQRWAKSRWLQRHCRSQLLVRRLSAGSAPLAHQSDARSTKPPFADVDGPCQIVIGVKIKVDQNSQNHQNGDLVRSCPQIDRAKIPRGKQYQRLPFDKSPVAEKSVPFPGCRRPHTRTWAVHRHHRSCDKRWRASPNRSGRRHSRSSRKAEEEAGMAERVLLTAARTAQPTERHWSLIYIKRFASPEGPTAWMWQDNRLLWLWAIWCACLIGAVAWMMVA